MHRTLHFLLLPMTPEDLRYETRRFLASRPTGASVATTIRHGLVRWGVEATEAEISAACIFLAGLPPPQATGLKASLGSSQAWQITSAGILAFERNE
jgi:hypothetical protein